MLDPIRTAYCPPQGLHAAQRTSHDSSEFFDAEIICQTNLGLHPVFHRQDGEVSPPRFAGSRVDGGRAGGSETGTDVVDADDKETVGVDSLAGADHVVPPADVFRIIRVDSSDMVGRVQGVADEYSIAGGFIQRAVGSHGQLILRQYLPASPFQWPRTGQS